MGVDKASLIESMYQKAALTPSDVSEHIPLLRNLATMCKRIVELGTGTGNSSAAFMATYPRHFLTVDTCLQPVVQDLHAASREGNINFESWAADDRTIEIPETDLLFIDTFHTSFQLRKELELHGMKARLFIILHDTITFGNSGEIPGDPGLWSAINEFLDRQRLWTHIHTWHNNNGLTLLGRKQP